MTSFKESVIVPLAIFQKCDYSKAIEDKEKSLSMQGGGKNERTLGSRLLNIPDEEPDSELQKQKNLLNERLSNKKKYDIITPDSYERRQIAIPINIGIRIDEILKHIRTSQKPNVKMILEKLMKNNILWNRHGEISAGMDIILDSNIIKLMQFFSGTSKVKNYYQMPVGTEELWKILHDIQVPTSWIKQKPFTKEEPYPFIFPLKYPLETATDDEYGEEKETPLPPLKRKRLPEKIPKSKWEWESTRETTPPTHWETLPTYEARATTPPPDPSPQWTTPTQSPSKKEPSKPLAKKEKHSKWSSFSVRRSDRETKKPEKYTS